MPPTYEGYTRRATPSPARPPGTRPLNASAAGAAPASLREWLARLPWPLLGAGWGLAFASGALLALAIQALGWWSDGAAWERAALVAAQRTVSPTLDLVLLYVPLIGTNYSLAPLVAVAVIWLWRRGRPVPALHLGVVQLGSWTLNPAIKFAIPRPRPDLFELRGQFAFPAYPSGHSIAVVAVLGTAAYLVHRSGHGTWTYWVVGGFYLLNSYSRIYLAVHWPTDVVGGTVVGAIWLAATLRAFHGLHR